MIAPQLLRAVVNAGRVIEMAQPGDPALGPLTNLPGKWSNVGNLAGHGWNMIALPFKTPGATVQPDTPDQKSDYRLLLNQFDETLEFSVVDKGVPNRGAAVGNVFDRDQHVAALQYVQDIHQLAAIDFPATPDTNDTPKTPAAIHREPGLFLNMLSQIDNGPQIARLGTIPHGDAVLAPGHAIVKDGPPEFVNMGDFSALPVGVSPDVDNNPYLLPYKTFRDAPFKGLFDPTNPLDLLKKAVEGVKIKRTTSLIFDTTTPTGGINNIPFVVKQANATAMRAIFWIEELQDPDAFGNPQFQIQYAQRVLLDFFSFSADPNNLIRWPHISINTMMLTT